MGCAPRPAMRRALGAVAILAGVLVAPAMPGPVGSAARTAWTARVTPVAPAASGGSSPRSNPRHAEQARSVVLVTGDRVLVPRKGRRTGEVVPGPGRSGMAFLTRRFGSALHVIPADALPLVTAGVLDPRLFDLSALLAAQHGPHQEPPLDVTYRRPGRRLPKPGANGSLWAAVRPLDATTRFRTGVRRIALDDGQGPTPPGWRHQRTAGPTPGRDADAGTHELTVTHLDRSGRRTDRFGDLVFALDDDRLEFPTGDHGKTRLRLPPGRYHLEATVLSGSAEDPDFHTVVRPLITLDRDVSVTIDARATRPVTVEAPRAGARLALADLAYRRNGATPTRVLESGILSRRLDDTHTAHQGPEVGPDEMVDRVHTQWARPDGTGGFADTPYVYGLYWLTRGRYLTGFTGRVGSGDLATVRSRHLAQADDGGEVRRSFAPSSSTVGGFGGWSVGIPFTTPSTVTAHLMAEGVRWSGSLAHTSGTGRSAVEQSWLSAPPQAYTAGQAYDEGWNAAVLGPALAVSAPGTPPAVARHGNRIVVAVPMYADQAGHLGGSRTDRASTTLYRGRGREWTKVAATDEVGSGEFVVASRRATYQLVTSATRSGFADLSTRVKASWTFRSARAPRSGQALPVSVVRFAPPVDARNHVSGRAATLVPVTVQTQLGKPHLGVRSLSVHASTDDGRSWEPVRFLHRPHGERVAVIPHPADPAYVSLRSRVVDLHGNESEQTVIRAYAVR
jgi:hypothetical protein